jgi:hypothetical protein
MSREYEVTSFSDNLVLNLEDLLAIGDRSGIKHSGEAWKEPEPGDGQDVGAEGSAGAGSNNG